MKNKFLTRIKESNIIGSFPLNLVDKKIEFYDDLYFDDEEAVFSSNKKEFNSNLFDKKDISLVNILKQKYHIRIRVRNISTYTTKEKIMIDIAEKIADLINIQRLNPSAFKRVNTDKLCFVAERFGQSFSKIDIDTIDMLYLYARIQRMPSQRGMYINHMHETFVTFIKGIDFSKYTEEEMRTFISNYKFVYNLDRYTLNAPLLLHSHKSKGTILDETYLKQKNFPALYRATTGKTFKVISTAKEYARIQKINKFCEMLEGADYYDLCYYNEGQLEELLSKYKDAESMDRVVSMGKALYPYMDCFENTISIMYNRTKYDKFIYLISQFLDANLYPSIVERKFRENIDNYNPMPILQFINICKIHQFSSSLDSTCKIIIKKLTEKQHLDINCINWLECLVHKVKNQKVLARMLSALLSKTYESVSNGLIYANMASNIKAYLELAECYGNGKVINLSTLSESNFRDIAELSFYTETAKVYEENNMRMNIEELLYIANHSTSFVKNTEILKVFSNLKSHSRVIKLKEYIQIQNCMAKTLDSSYPYCEIGYKYINEFMDYSKKLTMHEFMNKPNNMIRNSDEYNLFVTMNVFNHFVDNTVGSIANFKNSIDLIKLNSDQQDNDVFIDFITEYKSICISDTETTSKNVAECIKGSKLIKLKDLLNIDEEFISKNINRCVNFCLSNKYDIFVSYMKNRNATESAKENLKLITIGILADKYRELKFNYNDICREIGYKISYNAFAEWKKTETFERDGYKLEDASDFETIMTIGAYPVESCMNYKNGSYSHCLISNFDSCKKILRIYKNDKYIGRAILRLTMAYDEKPQQNHDNILRFKNYATEEDSKVTENNKPIQKELVLFVEKIYSTAAGEENIMVNMIAEFLKDKCAKMDNCKLIISNANATNGTKYVDKLCYVQVNLSKNGSQYMDSLGGSLREVNKLAYYCSNFRFYNVNNEEVLAA